MGKVFDAFMFFNELDVLELRLHELNSVVDHFIIVESAELHGSTETKPCFLAENWERFAPFHHKIKLVQLEHLEPAFTDYASGWKRENFQRSALMAPVLELSKSPDDIMILSDCDEIPRSEIVRLGAELSPKVGMCKLELDFYFYNINNFIGKWSRSTIGTIAQYMAAGGFNEIRDITLLMDPYHPRRNEVKHYHSIPEAGWHFSYFGDIEHMRRKVASFAHSTDGFAQEMLARSDDQIASDILNRSDLFRRPVSGGTFRPTNDPRLPSYMRSNMDKYGRFTEEFFKQQRTK